MAGSLVAPMMSMHMTNKNILPQRLKTTRINSPEMASQRIKYHNGYACHGIHKYHMLNFFFISTGLHTL